MLSSLRGWAEATRFIAIRVAATGRSPWSVGCLPRPGREGVRLPLVGFADTLGDVFKDEPIQG